MDDDIHPVRLRDICQYKIGEAAKALEARRFQPLARPLHNCILPQFVDSNRDSNVTAFRLLRQPNPAFTGCESTFADNLPAPCKQALVGSSPTVSQPAGRKAACIFLQALTRRNRNAPR